MTDSVARWARVQDIFHTALERTPAERDAFLREACGDDHALRAEVDSLLLADEEAGTFAERPAIDGLGLSAMTGSPDRQSQPGDRPGDALDGSLHDDRSAIVRGHMTAAGGSDRSPARVVRPRLHAPWWLFIVAASFLAYSALAIYLSYFGPEPSGVAIDFGESGLLVRTVSAESPAARAGVKPGDRLVAVDGRERRNLLDWTIVKANFEVGRPNRWQIERDSDRREVIVTLERRSRTWSQQSRILMTLGWGAKLITLILAFVIGFKRAHEPLGLVGALSLASVTSGDWGGVPPISAKIKAMVSLSIRGQSKSELRPDDAIEVSAL